MVKELTQTEILIEDLFKKAEIKRCCPYIRKDDNGPYCAKNLDKNTAISEQRRMVCDALSLQLWCLDPNRFERCIYFQEEPIE